MSETETDEMERQRRQEDVVRLKRENRYLITIVGQGLGLLVMLGFYWAILTEVQDDMSNMVMTVNAVAIEQAKRTPTIERASRFMDDHSKEHLKYWQDK